MNTNDGVQSYGVAWIISKFDNYAIVNDSGSNIFVATVGNLFVRKLKDEYYKTFVRCNFFGNELPNYYYKDFVKHVDKMKKKHNLGEGLSPELFDVKHEDIISAIDGLEELPIDSTARELAIKAREKSPDFERDFDKACLEISNKYDTQIIVLISHNTFADNAQLKAKALSESYSQGKMQLETLVFYQDRLYEDRMFGSLDVYRVTNHPIYKSEQACQMCKNCSKGK